MKKLDLVRRGDEPGIFVVLGLGKDGEDDIALIAGVYNIVSEHHASIPNELVYVKDLNAIDRDLGEGWE